MRYEVQAIFVRKIQLKASIPLEIHLKQIVICDNIIRQNTRANKRISLIIEIKPPTGIKHNYDLEAGFDDFFNNGDVIIPIPNIVFFFHSAPHNRKRHIIYTGIK